MYIHYRSISLTVRLNTSPSYCSIPVHSLLLTGYEPRLLKSNISTTTDQIALILTSIDSSPQNTPRNISLTPSLTSLPLSNSISKFYNCVLKSLISQDQLIQFAQFLDRWIWDVKLLLGEKIQSIWL